MNRHATGVSIAVLRHASTAWNEQGRLQGQTDTALSAMGEADARLWRIPEPACGWRRVCSPLHRARRTAELLQPTAPVSVDSRLREMSFGVWEGHTLADLRRTVGEKFLDAERRGLAATLGTVSTQIPRALGPGLGGYLFGVDLLAAPFLVAVLCQGAYLVLYRRLFRRLPFAGPG